MNSLFKTGSAALIVVLLLISVMPLVILELPWWGDLIYYALIACGFASIAFPAVMVWAFVVELQQPVHDWFGVAFLIITVFSTLVAIITFINNRR